MEDSLKMSSRAHALGPYDASRKFILHERFVKIELWAPAWGSMPKVAFYMRGLQNEALRPRPGARKTQAENRFLHGSFVKSQLWGPGLGPV